MNIENRLDELKKIAAVDAPPFLYTRIRQRIQSLEAEAAPPKWKWGFALASLLVVLVNLSIWFQADSVRENTGIESVVSAMQLSNSNAFYK